MAIQLFLASVAWQQSSLLAVFLYIIVFSLTVDPLTWIILPEVLNDQQFGFCTCLYFAFGAVTTLTTDYMVRYHSPSFFFNVNGAVSVFAMLFVVLFLKESGNISDKQKKELYFSKRFLKSQRTKKRKSK